MKRAVNVILALVILVASNHAFAFVDQIAVSPLAPHAGQPITISFRTGVCEGLLAPVVWELQGTGTVRDLVVNGVFDQEPLFCLVPIGTNYIAIGALPPGDYEVHIKIRDPVDGLGGIPSDSFGNVQFVVGQAQSIPAVGSLGLAVMIFALLCAAWVGRRKFMMLPTLTALALLGCITPTSNCDAQVSNLLEVTMLPPPAPSPESIVEGYDFASGVNPPFASLTAGNPTYAVYLLPFGGCQSSCRV